MSENRKSVRPFGVRDKIGYAFGDCANDFTFMLSSTALLKFYTDVMQVDAWIVGLLMMLARFIDAVTDVIMGQIADHSKVTPQGKFRPWIRRMAGPVCVASFLIYAVWFKDMPMAFKVFWMFFTYLLWGSVFYTSINIPYGSMASAITSDPKQRQSLSTFRTTGSIIAAMAISVCFPMFAYYKDAAGNSVLSGTNVMFFSLFCSIAAFILYLCCYGMTRERVVLKPAAEKFSFKKFWSTLIHDRALIAIILSALLLLLAQLTQSSMSNFIYPNYFGDAGYIAIAGIIGTISTFLLAPFAGKLTAKFGRKEVALAGALIGAAAMLAAFLMHTHSFGIWLIFMFAAGIGMAVFNLVVWAMITDVIDNHEVETGERADGAIYSVYSFARKLGQAASAGLSGVLITLTGYTTATAFDPAVTNGIYNITCLIPLAGFVLLALVLKFLYPLDRKKVMENTEILKKRREEK
jgi:GPH family glycoside/pentoside/hexuronide:cation symporter